MGSGSDPLSEFGSGSVDGRYSGSESGSLDEFDSESVEGSGYWLWFGLSPLQYCWGARWSTSSAWIHSSWPGKIVQTNKYKVYYFIVECKINFLESA